MVGLCHHTDNFKLQSSPESAMEKKARKGSSKYDHVKGTLDTGPTVKKVKVITLKEFLKRRDETFRRLKGETLVALIEEARGGGREGGRGQRGGGSHRGEPL